MVDCVRGQMAIAHNGNLINADLLRDELEHKGSIFQTTADSEIILHLLARPADNGASVLAALRRIEGAFSLLIMSERELIAVRDPFGWRSLALGKLDGAYIVASETCALDLIHAEFIREIEPGEVLIIDENGLRSERPFPDQQPAFCMFEYVYFSRPDSMLGNVGKVRMEMGRELARRFPVEVDIVVPGISRLWKLCRSRFCSGTRYSIRTRLSVITTLAAHSCSRASSSAISMSG